MKYPYTTVAMLSLLAVIVAPAFAANSHVESVLKGQGDLSKFHEVLITSGVANELNENEEYTLFAPTNAVFSEISPREFPCLYSASAQCRSEVAAVLRNHIAPRNASIQDLSKWNGGLQTIGTRRVEIGEKSKGEYTVDGRRVLYQIKGDKVSLYPIDGMIVSNQELALTHTEPLGNTSDSVTTSKNSADTHSAGLSKGKRNEHNN